MNQIEKHITQTGLPSEVKLFFHEVEGDKPYGVKVLSTAEIIKQMCLDGYELESISRQAIHDWVVMVQAEHEASRGTA